MTTRQMNGKKAVGFCAALIFTVCAIRPGTFIIVR